jgi:sterol desaturase/sphingolipid hydroxylase (fatty acid hydroxylase superfamily)
MGATTELDGGERRSGWQPRELIQTPPVFVWPPRPLGFLKWLFGSDGYLWPWNALFAALALLAWRFATPPLPMMKHAAIGWIALIFARNLVLITLYASAWHWRLYAQRAQGIAYKYNSRWPTPENSTFLLGSQLRDNLFWTLFSAVPIWTTYEVLTFWLQANGYVPTVSWELHPAYCTLLMLSIPLLRDIHFYAVHRLIHWPPLYRTVHYLHHKNVNPGPWSGMAMHPVEHILYFSGVVLHWIIPSHPLHVLFHLYHLALSPAVGHSGFHRVLLNRTGGVSLTTGSYRHYLHHKYFEVNYGGDGICPIDKWCGTFHDGSEEAQQKMKQRLNARRDSRASV